MERYIIDTNTVSDYFSASLTENGLKFMDSVVDAIPIISIITQIELLCWKSNAVTERSIRDFINDSIILDINADVISHCVLLRRTKKIKTPDAIIAATALAQDCTLITNNEKDFYGYQRIENSESDEAVSNSKGSILKTAFWLKCPLHQPFSDGIPPVSIIGRLSAYYTLRNSV